VPVQWHCVGIIGVSFYRLGALCRSVRLSTVKKYIKQLIRIIEINELIRITQTTAKPSFVCAPKSLLPGPPISLVEMMVVAVLVVVVDIGGHWVVIGGGGDVAMGVVL
jgi:hypothetical protein